MFKIPKYQWLIEDFENECGFCDKLYLPHNAERKFQVRWTPTVLFDEKFTGNNVAKPVTGAAYEFNVVDTAPSVKHFITAITLVKTDGTNHAFVFAFDPIIPTDITGIPYTITEYSDFTLVKIDDTDAGGTPHFLGNLRDVLAMVLSGYVPGITVTVVSSTHIKIDNLPANTQVQTNEAKYPTISGLGSNTWGLNNFHPLVGKGCFVNISCLDGAGACTTTPSMFKEGVVIAENKKIVFTINYTNNFSFPVNVKLYIRDDSFGLIEILVREALPGMNTMYFSYTTPAIVPASFTFDFGLQAGDILGEFVGFCFNALKAERLAAVQTVATQTCEEGTLNFPEFTETWDGMYNSLIEITGAIDPGALRLTILDDEDTQLSSMWYEVVNQTTNCDKGKLFRLLWSNDCKFGDLNYLLPFNNELLLNGVSIYQPRDKVDMRDNVTGSGKRKSYYRHTIEQWEFRFHPYSWQVQQAIQAAFEHNIIKVDGDVYYLSAGEQYAPNEIDNGIYTGTVDALKDDSAIVNSACCCTGETPQTSITQFCGIITDLEALQDPESFAFEIEYNYSELTGWTGATVQLQLEHWDTTLDTPAWVAYDLEIPAYGGQTSYLPLGDFWNLETLHVVTGVGTHDVLPVSHFEPAELYRARVRMKCTNGDFGAWTDWLEFNY